MPIKPANMETKALLGANLNTTATTITLQAGNGSKFPTLAANEYFYATLVNSSLDIEIVRVTARSGDSLTVVRAQDGTTAKSFSSGSAIQMRWNVAQIKDTIQDRVLQNTVQAAKTANYTIVASDNGTTVRVDATSGNRTITLPAASANFRVAVVKVDSSANTVTVQRSGSDTINGATTRILSDQYQGVYLQGTSGFWLSNFFSGQVPQSIVTALGNVSGSTTLDLSTGIRAYSATVTGTTTFVFSNPRASGNEDIFTLRLTNGGSSTVTWPTSVKWAGGTAPTLTASGVDELVFKTINGGSIWAGAALLDVK